MSKSMTERAEDFIEAKRRIDPVALCLPDVECMSTKAIEDFWRRVYIKIATEQKTIDDEEYRKEREKQWILVSEHTMPRCYRIDDEKRSKQLLFKTRDGRTHFGIYSYYPTGEWCCDDGSLDEDIPASSGEVTHWHPLPDDKVEFEE